MNTTIPCHNCITLAACKHKTKILCDILYDWADSHRTAKYKDEMQKTFGISGERRVIKIEKSVTKWFIARKIG